MVVGATWGLVPRGGWCHVVVCHVVVCHVVVWHVVVCHVVVCHVVVCHVVVSDPNPLWNCVWYFCGCVPAAPPPPPPPTPPMGLYYRSLREVVWKHFYLWALDVCFVPFAFVVLITGFRVGAKPMRATCKQARTAIRFLLANTHRDACQTHTHTRPYGHPIPT